MAMVDLDKILNPAVMSVWGDTVSYLPLASQPNTPAFAVVGIFDRAHEIILTEIAASELSAAGHSTTAPVLEVRLSQFALPPRKNDRVVIGAETFTVWDVKPDGCGHADLILRERI